MQGREPGTPVCSNALKACAGLWDENQTLLCHLVVTSVKMKSLWSVLSTWLGYNVSTGLPRTGVVSGTLSLSLAPRTVKVLRLKAVLQEAL